MRNKLIGILLIVWLIFLAVGGYYIFREKIHFELVAIVYYVICIGVPVVIYRLVGRLEPEL